MDQTKKEKKHFGFEGEALANNRQRFCHVNLSTNSSFVTPWDPLPLHCQHVFLLCYTIPVKLFIFIHVLLFQDKFFKRQITAKYFLFEWFLKGACSIIFKFSCNSVLFYLPYIFKLKLSHFDSIYLIVFSQWYGKKKTVVSFFVIRLFAWVIYPLFLSIFYGLCLKDKLKLPQLGNAMQLQSGMK